MDYLYGKLCQYIEEKEYSGKTTDTAKVTVDNHFNTIKVDVLTDDTLSATSNKPIQSKAVYNVLKNLSKPECDKELSEESDNPIANKAVARSLSSIIQILSDFGLITIATNDNGIFSDNEDNSFIIQDDITIDELLSLISEKMPCSSIAKNYDNSINYHIGDYVTYNGKLYECIKETNSYDDFILENWEEVCLFDILKYGSNYLSIGKDNAGEPFIIDTSSLMSNDTVPVSYSCYNAIVDAIESNQLIYIKTSNGAYSSVIGIYDDNGHPYDLIKPNSQPSSVPTLASSDTWYKGSVDKSAIESISIMDSYLPTGDETESWNADSGNVGKIKCYIIGNKLIIAGNGSGKILAHKNSSYAFAYFSSLTEIDNLSFIDFSAATTLVGTFYNCTALTHLDVSNFNTSKVTSMRSMFYNCKSLLSGYSELSIDKIQNPNFYILDVSNWDTSNVTDMGWMFANCISIVDIDTSNWDVANVTDMSAMFQASGGNGSYDTRGNIVELHVENWRPRKCTNFGWWCWGQMSLRKADISKWEVGYEVKNPIIDLDHFFSHCRRLNTQTFDSWDFSKVKNFDAMLNETSSFKSINGKPAYDVSNWDVSNAVCMSQMFENYNSNSIGSIKGLGTWKTSSLKNMGEMFRTYYALEELDFTNFDTTHLIDTLWKNDARGLPGFNSSFGNLTTFEYVLTKDTQLNKYKKYFIRTGSGTTDDPYIYNEAINPSVDNISVYYEQVAYSCIRSLQKVTFGLKFDFRGGEFGDGDKLTGNNVFKFPKPSNQFISGVTGQWFWQNHPDTMTDEEATYSDIDKKGYFDKNDLPNPPVVGQEVILVAVGSKYDIR